jgi:hypothetical protein
MAVDGNFWALGLTAEDIDVVMCTLHPDHVSSNTSCTDGLGATFNANYVFAMMNTATGKEKMPRVRSASA